MAFFSPKVFSHPSWGRKASACRGCVHVWPLRERKEAPRAEKWTGVLLQRAPKRRLGVGPAAESPKAVSQSAKCGGGKSRPPNRERGCARNFIPAFFLFFFPRSSLQDRRPVSSILLSTRWPSFLDDPLSRLVSLFSCGKPTRETRGTLKH